MPSTLPKNATDSAKKNRKKKTGQFSLGIIVPLTPSNNSEQLCQACEVSCELGFKVTALAEGDQASQERCFDLGEHYGAFNILESSDENRQKIIKDADVIIFCKKPKKAALNEVLAENVPMVIPAGCGLENFNPQKESGEAFTFEEGNFWQLVSALIRASENKKFTYDWSTLKKNLSKV